MFRFNVKPGLMLAMVLPGTVAIGLAPTTSTSTLAASEREVDSRDELIRAVRSARPGDRIRVAPGDYEGGLLFEGVRGNARQPVVVEALDEERPPVIRGGSSSIHLVDPAHVVLRNLVLDGASANGLNIDDGGSFDSPAERILLEGLVVRRVGPRGNRDGIKLSGVTDFRVDRCTVERWGAGGSAIDMVGCHRGVIEGCTFRHEKAPGANGVQTKGGSRDIAVRHCRFEDAGGRAVNIGGSTGKSYFRPRPEGFEAKDIIVEDCTFIGSQAPVAFVGVDGAVVRHNTIYRPGRWILRILQETRDADFVACRDGQFEKNIIAYRADEISTVVNIGSGTAPETFRFSRNFWYCMDRPQESARASRALPTPEKGGVYGKNPGFVDAEEGRLELQRTSPARGYGPRAERKR